jgi:hypothetical protein
MEGRKRGEGKGRKVWKVGRGREEVRKEGTEGGGRKKGRKRDISQT